MLAMVGCEVIKEDDRLIEVPTPSGTGRTHVLIEFTGFRCVNCPTAANIAHELKQVYGEQLIVVAMHPASNPFTQGLYDYTCPAADSIYRLMGGTASTPFPTGNIDMALTDDRYFCDPATWTGSLARVMADTASASLTTDYRTSYWLVEDSVLGVQAMPDGSVNTSYYHRHVLRAASDRPEISSPEGCDPAHCTMVRLMIDKNDNHIVDAYETKLTDFSTHSARRH